MKERNLWYVEFELESLAGRMEEKLYVSTKSDYEPDAIGIIHQVIQKKFGDEWGFEKFLKVECLGQVFSIKKL